MVDTYTDMIIDMFVKEYTPEEICKEMKLCGPAIREFNGLTNEIPPVEDSEEEDEEEDEEEELSVTPYCGICEFAVDYLEKKLVNNRYC